MTVVEFLAHVLDAHGTLLKQLHSAYGLKPLLHALQHADFSRHSAPPVHSRMKEFHPNPFSSFADPLLLLETAVASLRLPDELETHLWDYPFYRGIIEETDSLEKAIPSNEELEWVDAACTYSLTWIENLAIDPSHLPTLARMAREVAFRFRAQVMFELDRTPLTVV